MKTLIQFLGDVAVGVLIVLGGFSIAMFLISIAVLVTR